MRRKIERERLYKIRDQGALDYWIAESGSAGPEMIQSLINFCEESFAHSKEGGEKNKKALGILEATGAMRAKYPDYNHVQIWNEFPFDNNGLITKSNRYRVYRDEEYLFEEEISSSEEKSINLSTFYQQYYLKAKK